MNTAIAMGIGLVGIAALALGFFVALRAKRQFGFLAPLGFLCAVLINRICLLALIPAIQHSLADTNKDKMRAVVSKLSPDDLVFYLGINGHADGIWFLGAILFLTCGWIDLKSSGAQAPKKVRLALIVGGALLMALAAVYPVWMKPRFW
ncbi:MAG: hypothetical protein ACYC67_18480 [Prosthecobacter sp.]